VQSSSGQSELYAPIILNFNYLLPDAMCLAFTEICTSISYQRFLVEKATLSHNSNCDPY